jgi:hypothetical protein
MQKHYRKVILVVGLILLGIFLIYRFAIEFAPGSYPYAETYELNAPETEVINTINQFKTDHPELYTPKVQIQNNGQFDLNDGRNDSSDLWYSIYFYYPKENQIVYTWARSEGKQKTTFAFVAVNSSLTLGNWKRINKDFSSNENKKLKEQFEERILDSIKQRLANLQ